MNFVLPTLVGGMLETVVHRGTGFLASTWASEDLSSSILQFLHEPK